MIFRLHQIHRSRRCLNNFELTQVWAAYLNEADNTPPIMESAPTDPGRFASPGMIAFTWKEAKEYDTGIADYRLEVKAQPGNITIFNQWVGNKLSHTVSCNYRKILFARVQAKNGAGLIGDWSGWSDGITLMLTGSTDFEIADESTSEENSDGKNSIDGAANDIGEFPSKKDIADSEADLFGAASVATEVPSFFEISQNYPNPFNSSTIINYQLPEDCQVVIKIFNARGEEVRTLVDEFKKAAYHSATWNGKDDNGNAVASGIYLYRIVAGKNIATQKMVFVE